MKRKKLQFANEMKKTAYIVDTSEYSSEPN